MEDKAVNDKEEVGKQMVVQMDGVTEQKVEEDIALQTSRLPTLCPSEDSLDDFINDSHTPAKRRKVHMTAEMCQKYSESKEGRKSLALGSQLPNKDINLTHLRPKPNRKRKSVGVESNDGEITSSNLQNCNAEVAMQSEEPSNKNKSFKSTLVSSFNDGRMGGFTTAAKIHDDNPGLTLHFDVKPSMSPSIKSMVSAKNKDSTTIDTHQKSIKNFFGTSSQSSSQPLQSQKLENEAIVISDSPCATPEKREEIDYSSPVKMFSPIKKLQGSTNIYINDDSPSCSQSSQNTLKNNAAVKQLFEGQKQYQSNKITQGKGKRSNSKSSTKSSAKKSKPRVHAIKQETRFSTGNISSEDDDILCTAVDLASEKYGLFGAIGNSQNREEKPQINYFDHLPDELLEIIFAQLPMLDLCLNSNRVCTRWSQIISSERFVPWKKTYNRLKKDQPGAMKEMLKIMIQNKMHKHADYLTGLIRYMKTFKPITAHNMIQCLQRHKKYSWAKALMEERLTDCIIEGDPNPWSCIATLVIISQSVYDIEEIIQCLLVPSSQCTSIEILECLYCIATILYAFKRQKSDDIWNGIHYRLFYALYLYENASSTSLGDLKSAITNKGGQQSLMKYSRSDTSVKMTHEQTRIVSYNVQPGEIIKIVAFAGTGKTTTLVKYTKMRPSMRFLLVVYNKSVCQYANTQFPGNVVCKTGHALAFQFTGRKYSAAKKLGNLKVYAITQSLPSRKGDNLYIRAKFVMDTVNTFIASADPCITTEHVPDKRMDDDGRMAYVDPDKKSLYVKDAEIIWSKMLDLGNHEVYMTHDGYLKIYQLSKPKLLDYDCILIDEAQDMSPALADILLSQPQAKILVGDPHQQIYAFRGAVNAMSRVSATNIFYLTQLAGTNVRRAIVMTLVSASAKALTWLVECRYQVLGCSYLSFRFGPEISHVAYCCLETLKEEKMKTLVGNGKKCKINGETIGQVAVICRSNFTVFNEAVKKCCYRDSDIKIGFVGGTDAFGFPVIQDIHTLLLSPEQRHKEGREIKDKFIKRFSNLGELEKYATKTQDHELMGKIKIVRTHHVNLISHINKILSKCVRDNKMADYLFSTAHKAKGLEFSTVKVTDDYGVNPILQKLFSHHTQYFEAMPYNAREVNMDEGNLLYVAVTRAKHALQISPTLRTILTLCGEKFEHPVSSEQLQRDGVTMKCCETDQEFKPYALTLQRESVKISDDNTVFGGLLSPDILTDDRKSLALLYGLLEKDKKARSPKKKRPVGIRYGQHGLDLEDLVDELPFPFF